MRTFPIGREVTLDRLDENPYPILAELRAHEPVSWIPETGMWFVTRRDDVLAILNDPDLFTVEADGSLIRDIFGRHMMTIDGDEQIRHKRSCIAPFKPGAIDQVATLRAYKILNDLAIRLRSPAELRSDLARPLAVRTVAAVLGFRDADVPVIGEWYDAFAAALANFVRDEKVAAAGRRASKAFGYRAMELAGRRSGSGLIQTLAAHAELTEDEIISNALIIMFGGIETTEGMICNTIRALRNHPDQWNAVRDNRTLVRAALDEALRWEPSVQSCTRHLRRATTLRGIGLPAGSTIQCMLGAANRDPEHFERPDVFDITRPRVRDHVSFGAGRHYCLGAPLAYREAECVLNLLFDRMPALEFDPGRPACPRGYEFRKPPELWVRW